MQITTNSTIQQRRKRRIKMYAIFVLLAIFAVFAFFRYEDLSKIFGGITDVFMPIIYGVAMAYILNPVVNFFEGIYSLVAKKVFKAKTDKYKKFSKKIGILFAIILLILLIYLIFSSVIPQLYDTVMSVVSYVPSGLDKIMEFYTELTEGENTIFSEFGIDFADILENVKRWFTENLANAANSAFQYIKTGIMSTVSFVTDFVLGLCVAIYFLNEKQRIFGHIKKITYALMNDKAAQKTVKTGIHAKTIFNGYMYGRLIGCSIVFAATFIFMTLMGMPYALLISIVVGTTNFIPLFGPFLGAIPSGIILLLYNPMMAIWFGVFTLIIQQIEGNILTPLIISDVTGVPPFWVTVAMIVGGGFFGVAGLVLSVPIFSIIYYLIKSSTEQKLENKNMPTSTENYIVNAAPPESMFDIDKIRKQREAKKENKKKKKK